MNRLFQRMFHYSIFGTLILSLLFAGQIPVLAKSDQSVQPMTATKTVSLRIQAYIDGKSTLVLQGKGIHWYHLDFSAPGREGYVNNPTIIKTSQWVDWYPQWPDGFGYEVRDCHCSSSSYTAIPALAKQVQTVSLKVTNARGTVKILKQPTAANKYLFVVEFNDDPQDGADWYDITLKYKSPVK
jgi:hypothetical protein